MTAAVGIQWVQNTDTYTRLEGLASATTQPQATAICNTMAPFNQMQRVNLLDNGVVSAVYGDRCYTDTDVATMGQCMVYIPQFWYYTNHSPPTYRWYISGTGTDTIGGSPVTWKVHPMFIRNNVIKPRAFISTYEGYVHDMSGTLRLESKAGVQPSSDPNTTLLTGAPHGSLDNFRTWAHNRVGAANQWEIEDINIVSGVNLMGLIEYATYRWRTNVFAGVSALPAGSGNNSINTGATASLGNVTGQVPVTVGVNTTYPYSFHGIENFSGNMYKFVDGINVQAYEVGIADHSFVSNTFAAPYTDTGLAIASAAGYPTDIISSPTYDFLFAPKTMGGAAGTYLSYYCGINSANRVGQHGGAWSVGPYSNFFDLNFGNASGAYSASMGARLSYIG